MADQALGAENGRSASAVTMVTVVTDIAISIRAVTGANDRR